MAAPTFPCRRRRLFGSTWLTSAIVSTGQSPDVPWSHALKAGTRAAAGYRRLGIGFFRIRSTVSRSPLISTDGDPVEPLVVNNLVIGTAQRYDVLVTLPESGSYTLHAAALGDDKQALGVLHTPDVAPLSWGRTAPELFAALNTTDADNQNRTRGFVLVQKATATAAAPRRN